MFDKLKIGLIYDDFLKKMHLTEEQKKILDMLINKDSILKISLEIGISERTVSYEVKKIKQMYKQYCDIEITRLLLMLD